MTKRWLQEKLNKQKRMRRAYLKRYPSHIDYGKMALYDQYNPAARVNGLEGKRDNLTPAGKVDMKGKFALDVRKHPFLQEVPPTKHISARRYGTIMQADRLQNTIEFIKGPLLTNFRGILVHLWFTGSNYMIIEEGKTYRATSIIYNDRFRIMQAWQNKSLCWSKVEKFNQEVEQKFDIPTP